MPTKQIERLLFAQGGRCFFCHDTLSTPDASVEHLVALANGGGNSDENCVACCTALNALLGRMSLKEKLGVMLNQNGAFKCPNGAGGHRAAPNANATAKTPKERLALIIADLRRRGASRPRTVKTLTSTVNALFKKQLSQTEVASLLRELQGKRIVSVDGTKVSYSLPASDA